MFLLQKWNDIYKNALLLTKMKQILKSHSCTELLELLRECRMLEVNILCLLLYRFSFRFRNIQERSTLYRVYTVFCWQPNNTSKVAFCLISCRPSYFNSETAKQILLKFGIGNLYPNVHDARTVCLHPYYKYCVMVNSLLHASKIIIWLYSIYNMTFVLVT